MIGIGIAFLVALALMAAGGGAKAGKPTAPPPDLPPVIPGPPDSTKPTVQTTGKSGTVWLTQQVGFNGSTGYLYVDVFLPDGSLGVHPTFRVLRYSQAPGNPPRRAFMEAAPGVDPKVLALAMSDFNLQGAAVGPINVQDMSAALQQELADALKALTVGPDGKIVGPVTAAAIQLATSVAGDLDRAGFGAAATALRAFIAAAASLVASPPADKKIPLPASMPQDLQDMVNRALALERDPAKLTAILNALKAYQPQTPDIQNAIQMLQALIVQVQAAQAAKDALDKIKKVTNPPAQITPPPIATPAYGGQYTVQAGDSAASIATKFTGSAGRKGELDAVNTNHMPRPTVNVWTGEVLHLPTNWPSTPPGVPAQAAPPQMAVPGPTAPTGSTYTVQAGESAASIAQKFTGSAARKSELDAVNKNHSPLPTKNVWTGEVLHLPANWPSAPNSPPPAMAVPTSAPGASASATYTVQAGDSAAAIAQRFTGSAGRKAELDGVNPHHSPKPTVNIWPGEVLNLPASWQSAAPPQQVMTTLLPDQPMSVPATATPQPAPVPMTPVEVAADAMVRNLKAVQRSFGFPTSHGKEDRTIVSRFQSAAYLTADGAAGPGTLVAAAANGGQYDLPYVHEWPKSATAARVLKYRQDLQTVANTLRANGNLSGAAQIEASAAREHGEGGIVGPLAV